MSQYCKAQMVNLKKKKYLECFLFEFILLYWSIFITNFFLIRIMIKHYKYKLSHKY